MTIAEQQPAIERTRGVEQYRSRLERRQLVDAMLMAAWDVNDLRWDATNAHILPPRVIAATGEAADETLPYEDTLIGRVDALAQRAIQHFSKKRSLPDRQILMDSLVDASVAAIIRVSNVVPNNQKPLVAQAFATIGEIALQGIQLQPDRARAGHSLSNQYNALLFSELDYAEQTEPLLITSMQPDFMQRNEKELGDFFHGKVEQLLGPEHHEDFMYVRSAVLFASSKHGDQKRFDGTLNKEHILRLGIRLLEDEHFMNDPEDLKTKLAAALLHDVVEDTPTNILELEDMFGTTVGRAVNTLSRYNMATSEARSNIEYYGNFHDAPGFVLDIKGLDRIDNLEALLHLDLRSQDSDEIVFKGYEYIDETKTYYPALVANNPDLQNRLAYTTRAVEQYYPSPMLDFTASVS